MSIHPSPSVASLSLAAVVLVLANSALAVDCNSNGVPDDIEIALETTPDCNANGIPDECETLPDCNVNDVPDSCDVRGTLALEAPWMVKASQGVSSIATGDLDDDGDIDIVAVNRYSSTVSIILNLGDGNFHKPYRYAAGNGPISLVVADLDDDDDLDVAVSAIDSDTVEILFNDGSALFTSAPSIPVGGDPQDILAADLDGDGDLDLATSNEVGISISLLLNDGIAARGESLFGPAVIREGLTTGV